MSCLQALLRVSSFMVHPGFLLKSPSTSFSRLVSSVCAKRLMPTATVIGTQQSCLTNNLSQVRSYSGLSHGVLSTGLSLNTSPLLAPSTSTIQQVRTYKVHVKLKRRCKGCYFEKRQGRWYVECTLKPRHKQMQQMSKKNLFREDYSKGNVRLAANWGWQKKRIYWKGDQMDKEFYKPLIDYKTTTVNSPFSP